MNRRELLKVIAAACGGAVSPAVLGALQQGVTTQSQGTLSPKELDTVRALAEGILPRTDGSPGATDAGVASFIDTIVGGYLPQESAVAFRRGLAPLLDTDLGDVVPLLTRLDAATFGDGKEASEEEKAFYRTLKELTVAGYFTSEVGQTQALAELRPYGPYEADVEIDANTKAWS